MSIVSRLFGSDTSQHESADLSTQIVLDTLASERKRRTLEILDGHDDGVGVELPAVAEMLATLEADGEDEAYKRAYVSLYQTHIPQLEAHGIVRVEGALGNQGANSTPDRLYTTSATNVVLDALDAVSERVGGDDR